MFFLTRGSVPVDYQELKQKASHSMCDAYDGVSYILIVRL